jgi:nucleoside-diphosphate-sugar epimerase
MAKGKLRMQDSLENFFDLPKITDFYKGKTIMVTGASGLVGGCLTVLFAAAGARVVALSRSRGGTLRNLEECAKALGVPASKLGHMEFHEYGLLKVDNLPEKMFENVSAIWHCAADMRYPLSKRRKSIRANVKGTLDLYDRFCTYSRAPAKRFVFMSSLYAFTPGDTVFESAMPVPGLANSYQMGKCFAELALSQRARLATPVAVVRPPIILGSRYTKGEYSGGNNGMYQFLSHLMRMTKSRYADLNIGMSSTACVNTTLQDDFVKQCLHLAPVLPDTPMSYYNVPGTNIGVQRLFDIYNTTFGSHFKMTGKPNTFLDHTLNEGLQVNMEFANADAPDFRSNVFKITGVPKMEVGIEEIANIYKKLYTKSKPFVGKEVFFTKMLTFKLFSRMFTDALKRRIAKKLLGAAK